MAFYIDIPSLDTPALIVQKNLIEQNILSAINIAGDKQWLRPHVKTNKTREICEMMMQKGIWKFKCATIAEAEMLALAGAPDILLAYQPTGPKIDRFIELIKHYPQSRFSCIVDDKHTANTLNASSECLPKPLNVMIDVNVGMNRTGISPSQAPSLAYHIIHSLKKLNLTGLHGYDGHIHDTDLKAREQAADKSCAELAGVQRSINEFTPEPLSLVIGGTVTFPVHSRRQNVECSPGTFVFWDWGYSHKYPDIPFIYAAHLACRVVSVIDEHHVCIDLGYKSVASESPLPRVYFPDHPDAIPVAHSEEHLVLEVPDSKAFPVGALLFGIPKHICPTVALYEKMWVVDNGMIDTSWKIIARDRCINI